MMTTSYWSAVGTTSSNPRRHYAAAKEALTSSPVFLDHDLPRPVAGLDEEVVVAGLVDQHLVHRALAAAVAVGESRRGVESALGVDEEDGERVGIAAEEQAGVDPVDVEHRRLAVADALEVADGDPLLAVP